MPEFATTPPIPYVPISEKAAEVRAAINAPHLSSNNSFGGLQKLAIPGPFATDTEASTGGVPDDNLYYRSDGTVRAASHISLDLAFALDKTLTARTGPTPTFSRASSGLFTNANGILVGKTTGTTTLITPSSTVNGTSVTVTVASGSVVGWLVGQSVSLIVDTDGGNDNDAGELWLVGTIVSTTATELVFTVTSATTQTGNATAWNLGYRGARFDHDPITGVCKGLLIEEPRTNLIARSEEFDNSDWTKAGLLTTTPNSVASPDGATTADLITEDTGTSQHRVSRILTVVNGTTYTASVFVKRGSGSRKFGIVILSPTVVARVYFDLDANIVATTVAGSGTIKAYPNGWYLCTATGIAAATSATVYLQSTDGTGTGSETYTGDGTSGLYLWGAQVEVGAFPTSYIPTTIGTAARSADVCSIIGTDFSSFYNQTEGTLFSSASISNLTGINRGIAQIDDGSNLHIIRHYYDINGFKVQVKANDVASIFLNITGVADVAQKLAISQQGTSFNAVANGGTVSAVTRTSPVGLNALRIGNLTGGAFYLNGHIDRIQYFKKRLSNAKLQTITTL